MKKILLGFALLLSFQTLAFAQVPPGRSTWTSNRGSVLKLTAASGTVSGAFRGVFINRDPQIGCRRIPYPVTGTTFFAQVSFTVNFAKCGAVVKWNGDVAGPTMAVQYAMQRGGVTTVGFDIFNRN